MDYIKTQKIPKIIKQLVSHPSQIVDTGLIRVPGRDACHTQSELIGGLIP
ncbi:MAG: hypothetical protein ACYST3_04920 [Planctomycetota bacterium]